MNRAIGTCLKKVRIEQGLTQVHLAETLGKPQSFVSKIESGERSLHFNELFAYANALNMSAESLVSKVASAVQPR